jgi:thioesterase domain-containing protein/acyl carrier protein
MPADVQRWQTTSPGYNLVNSYGPTETTVVALAHYIYANQHESNSIPIGRPLPGYKPYIVDKQRNIVPFGVAGELHIAGSSVSPGYVDTKNDKAFVWLNVPESEQIRCYCTGDKVYADEHGIIHFVGRTDEQLKIRGYRVEPAEIEAQLNKIAGIENSIVLAQKTDKGEVSLVAFIKFANKNIETQAIKTQLKLSIPAYMIPDSFIPIQSIPLTLNGKIDKRKLLEMSHKYHSEKNEAIDKPTTETEKYLLDLWQKILGVKQIGIHDDFFEIGGHSLNAVALMAELKKDKDLKLPLASLINHSTIYKFAKLVTQEDKPDAWNCLVPIRTEGSKTPLFLIHGAGLNILLYKSLSTYLDPERPIYAFQASGLDGSKPLKSSLNEMATEYIDEMFRVQPSGSYILLGFSLGGFIAYEMSMQLRRLGKVVKFTGLIDSVSYLAHFYNSGFEKLKVDTISFIARPFYLTWLFLKTPKAEKARFFKLKINNFRLCMMYYLTKLRILKQQNIGEELEQLSFLSDNVLIAMNESLKKYQLKAADFPIDLFKAGKATFYIYEPENYGWSKFATKGITVHTIPSEHSRLFAAPYDRLFAEIIDKRLAEIEAHELVESE